jgi:methylated-DNA-[protein]-cysteine S-methyltransferase
MRIYDLYESPQGEILLAGNGAGLSGVYFSGQKYFRSASPNGAATTRTRCLRQAKQELAEYFAAVRKRFEVALTLTGTRPRRGMERDLGRGYGEDDQLWRALLAVPELAGRARAAGAADRTQSDRDHRAVPSHRGRRRKPDR